MFADMRIELPYLKTKKINRNSRIWHCSWSRIYQITIGQWYTNHDKILWWMLSLQIDEHEFRQHQCFLNHLVFDAKDMFLDEQPKGLVFIISVSIISSICNAAGIVFYGESGASTASLASPGVPVPPVDLAGHPRWSHPVRSSPFLAGLRQ